MARSRKSIVRVEGLSELDAALGELPKATAKNVLRRTATQALTPISVAAEGHARRRSGKLADSFAVGTKLSRGQRKEFPRESTVEVYAGPGPLTQAITEEFGTFKQAPHPTLRPAWDAGKDQALDTVGRVLGSEIEQAAARLARKRARAAKAG